jgi:hypothetical protein
VAYLALFVALGGTTYAAATIGAGDIENDAVRSRHLRNGDVRNRDVAAGSIGTAKILDGQVFPRDLNPAARTHKVHFFSRNAAKRRVLTLGNLELTADCVRSPGTSLTLRMKNLSDSETAEMRAGYHHRVGATNDSRTDFAHIAPGAEATVDRDDLGGTHIVGTANTDTTADKAEGQLIFAAPSQVTTLVFHAETVSGDANGFCELYGSAVTGTA